MEEKTPMADRLSPADVNPDHHLWRNGRFWWVAFTLIHDGWRQERIRKSLKTTDLLEARRRRDLLLAQYAGVPGAQLSLRFAPAATGAALRAA
jgi:hypothetical protein